jgi:hypothetical protein
MHLRCAWLFTRGPQSVRLEIREGLSDFTLWEHGPDQKSSHRVFRDYADALIFQGTRERALRDEGFALDVHEEWEPMGRRAPSEERRRSDEPVFPDWERRTQADRRVREFESDES